MDFSSILQEGNLVAPPNDRYAAKNWLEEQIWGHRLWHRQTPWLLFLEMLNVAAGRETKGTPFGSSLHDTQDLIVFRQRLLLRHLLFRNAEVDAIAAKARPDAELWDSWTKYFHLQLDEDHKRDLTFLRKRFPRFRDFAAVIKLLRETTVHPANSAGDTTLDRRWTSFFVFPFGAHAIYEDLDLSLGHDATRFGRTGDLLYQMLARSSHTAALKPLFAELLNSDKQITKLVAKLQEPADEVFLVDGRNGSYLPYRRHPAFDRLAEDWINIRNRGLAGYDAYQHMVSLAAFHVLLYHLETAAAWAGWPNVTFICEVLAPRPEAVRRQSVESFQKNEGSTTQALEVAWRKARDGAECQKVIATNKDLPELDQVAELKDFFDKKLGLSDEHKDCLTIDHLCASIWESIESKAEGNVGLLHRTYGRACGLVSRRGSRLYRYAPTDSFLKTIVLTTVGKRVELREFLDLLFKRYHLVFGPREAALANSQPDFEAAVFEKNALRLEERLHSMGMLNRLSDGVAFVENPTH